MMNYLDRMYQEYKELNEKIDKLNKFILSYDAMKNTLDCPFELLIKQLNVMQKYANILLLRLKYCENSIER